ncbi:(2Fe-2S)-binding protein [Sphingomonas sp. Sph1(2015)]|jgi:NADPH-dependent 2,4-dienoyl-CoA reductase/sulfur reductase-like enzyme/nitrite reductase/ring-hydroxylating ferredoxin subunit|uniref:FAD-dependent oxidoreductase n=1 Tax=Sphingomonas sp. Sph1(2015) TaxID=1628084 RepID=UPI0009786495|nr:FAD-dependent oxidoreductase [Sphingomonas sp. Sph1(2015)]OMJ32488.1 (2Fe-2S)-binding protein [Sphingomonas sp. Sph1(2015)]
MADRDLAKGIASSDVQEGRIVAGMLDGQDVLLVRHKGRVCALAGQCTHLKAPLADGIVADGTLRCPWHHARFDIETGEAVGAPAFAPLERFEVVEDDGQLRVIGSADPVPAPKAADTTDLGRIVIIGAGAAGHACAEMLARHGAGATVTVIGEEGDAPYDRTFCSKQYLAGKAKRDETSLPLPEGVDLRSGMAVSRIDRAAKAVVLTDGDTISYDRLVMATGAAVVSPDFYGADRGDVFALRTLADADRLIAAAGQAKRAIVIGSSYIGLEVAASLIARGLEVAVISEDDLPLEKTAGPEVGAMIRNLHESKGVAFHLNRRIARWDGHVAMLDDGSEVTGDIVVAGIGVRPRVELAEAAGLDLAAKADGGGVKVDAQLQTSDPAIYAIGDIANAPDPRLGHSIRVEHWVVAQRMGQWLARHFMGQASDCYQEVPFFWSGHYDLSLRYVGHVASLEDLTIDGDVPTKDFVVSFAEDGREQAVLTAGRDELALQKEYEWEQRGRS